MRFHCCEIVSPQSHTCKNVPISFTTQQYKTAAAVRNALQSFLKASPMCVPYLTFKALQSSSRSSLKNPPHTYLRVLHVAFLHTMLYGISPSPPLFLLAFCCRRVGVGGDSKIIFDFLSSKYFYQAKFPFSSILFCQALLSIS